MNNLADHDIVCELVLNNSDIRLIKECVRLIDSDDEMVHLTLSGNRKASMSLMPETGIPIVRPS